MKPIDHSYFKEEWENDEADTQEYSSPEGERDPMAKTALAAYQTMKDGCKTNPLLGELLLDTQNAIARYLISIAKLNELISRQKKGEEISKYTVGGADRSRRSAHDALIDSVNILSRAFAKFGLDNNWRNVVGLQTREQVTRWAIQVGSSVAADLAKPEK